MKFMLTLALVLFYWVGQRVSAETKPMNIVVLFADDWRYDTLGCAGNPVVKTPNLDQLAKEGIRFTHNCVTTSICGVSRATLFTGQWMSRHGNKAFEAFNTPWSRRRRRPRGRWRGSRGEGCASCSLRFLDDEEEGAWPEIFSGSDVESVGSVNLGEERGVAE